MLVLDTTTRKLQVFLAGAITTNQLPISVHYADQTASGWTPGVQFSNTNDTTVVDICAAPGNNTQRNVSKINIKNKDTVAATVTVRFNDNGTTYEELTFVLDSGDVLQFSHDGNWKVTASNGALKTMVGVGANAVTDVFNGDGSTVTFNLSTSPGNKSSTLVTISGVVQAKSSYSIVGSQIVFGTAPATGTANIEVVSAAVLGIGVPSDGTVSSSKLATNIAIAGTFTLSALTAQRVLFTGVGGLVQTVSGFEMDTNNIFTWPVAQSVHYNWSGFNATDVAGTLTNAPGTGTYTGNTNLVDVSNSSGTLTITFKKAGRYVINASAMCAHTQPYTSWLQFMTRGGTCTSLDPTGTLQIEFPVDMTTDDRNTYSTYTFMITATANQTLTLLPKCLLQSGGVVADHTAYNSVIITYAGANA